MFCCVSPSEDSLGETLNSLKYADRARAIKNKPIINRDNRGDVVHALKKEVSLGRFPSISAVSL